MGSSTPILHLLCGKIASGKSTLAADLANAEATVSISEDDWLDALFSDEISTGADYMRCSQRLQAITGPHVAALLCAGISVVLDFPANTVAQRRWMRSIIEGSGANHQLHLLDVPDEICLARLRDRNAQSEHKFAVTEAQYRQFAKHFVEPTPNERFNIVRHHGGSQRQ